MFGFPRSELVGKPVDVLLPERYRDGHPRRRRDFFAAPSVRQMGAGRDLFGRHKNGGEFPVEIGLNPYETPDGQFVLASIIDISARKEAELVLREKEARFRQIFESEIVGILFWGGDGEVYETCCTRSTGCFPWATFQRQKGPDAGSVET